MSNKRKKEDGEVSFEIPEKLLNQINEFSAGGFLLFTFDENGKPTINSYFDDMTHAIAMQSHIQTWIKALDHLNLKLMIQNIEDNDKEDGLEEI